MNKLKTYQGFTLIEIAIVLLIVSILLGYTVSMYSVQTELRQYRKAEAELERIESYLISFAQVNGRLPCPDTDTDGYENDLDNLYNDTGVVYAVGDIPDDFPDGCAQYTGFVPRGTLGLSGSLDENENMIDPWGQPYRYHISSVNTLSVPIDLVSPNDIRIEGLSNISPPDLFVCDDSNDVNLPPEIDCSDGNTGDSVVDNVSVIILSTGKEFQGGTSNIQDENLDADLVYTKGSFSDSAGSEFDDVIRWISPNILYSKMIEAGQLP